MIYKNKTEKWNLLAGSKELELSIWVHDPSQVIYRVYSNIYDTKLLIYAWEDLNEKLALRILKKEDVINLLNYLKKEKVNLSLDVAMWLEKNK